VTAAAVTGVTHLLFDGQSFAYTPTVATSHYGALIGLLPAHRYTYGFVASAATTYAQRAATAAGRVDSSIPKDRPTVLIDLAGQSDIIAAGSGGGDLTAAQTLSAMESYWTARRTAGVDYIIACTVPHMTSAWLDADGQTQRTNLNPLILASSGPDEVADIAALAHAADASNTTYFSDGLHPTATLAAEFAAAIESALAALGFPT
jgi:lysophospholipase L1-like esterase